MKFRTAALAAIALGFGTMLLAAPRAVMNVHGEFSLGTNGFEVAKGRAMLIDEPAYRPLAPEERGRNYKMECRNLRARAKWGWLLELEDGTGLGFGGIAVWTTQETNDGLQRSDDPAIRTRVRRDGRWVFITDELRAKNPLQSHHDRLAELLPELRRIYGLSRYIYFEGRSEAGERAFITERVTPLVAKFVTDLNREMAALQKIGGLDAYGRGQRNLALRRLARIAPALQLGERTDADKLAALRQARIELEQAAGALDAEPPPRAMAMLAYDPKTNLYAIFGGDHLDYLRNDLWVFDPKVQRWEERHPPAAPEPRGDALLMSDGRGRLRMSGGFLYARRPLPPGWDRWAYNYVHAGADEWAYDLATNTWTGPEEPPMVAADTRSYRDPHYLPEHYTQGQRPDSATHEKLLAELPVNTWVDLKPPLKFPSNRDWGTLGYDPKRDLIYFYNGGHSSYSGADVPIYHLAANRWDQPLETELPHGFIGASGQSMPGQSFNRRPWITNHLWNSYRFHPGLDRLLLGGRFTSPVFPKDLGNPDINMYLYDPDLADWLPRVPNNVEMSCMAAQIIHVPDFGLIDWGRWLLDDVTMEWRKLEPLGTLPRSTIDFCGLVYDPPRKRVLFFQGGYYGGKPYPGEVHAMSIPSLEVTSFTPDGAEHIGAVSTQARVKSSWILREVVYHPELDMFIFSSDLPGGYSAALDVKNNRWVGLHLPGPHPFGLSSAMAYDTKRGLVYAVGRRAEVSAARLDAKTLVVKPLSEIVKEAESLPLEEKKP